MPLALPVTERLHSSGNELRRFTDKYLASLHPPSTPSYFVSDDPSCQALYCMLQEIWPTGKLDNLHECPTGTDGCILHHIIRLNRQGQLAVSCELCCVDECLPALDIGQWAMVHDGLRRWELQENILRRTIDLTIEDTRVCIDLTASDDDKPTPSIDLISSDDQPIPRQILRSITSETTPFWLYETEPCLKAIYTILCHIRPELEHELVVCPNPPAGCRSYHIMMVDRSGRLFAYCERCDVKSRCLPLSISDYYRVQEAFLEWVDLDDEQVEHDIEMLRQEVVASAKDD
ncbi:hypothetical protein K435DRAFT_797627 [Dendrothele bispora CBS 962.96]|uniref:Uncharacterized protein n=1 Tax=Dendrothele bispora (strain CBS 962.96) TaxID=1314807 RepID=A0A4S8M2F2_DENBC|nr:hypothetical protein K435DRAFT_797627 [Dendrothele bispora CBS 962.96]